MLGVTMPMMMLTPLPHLTMEQILWTQLQPPAHAQMLNITIRKKITPARKIMPNMDTSNMSMRHMSMRHMQSHRAPVPGMVMNMQKIPMPGMRMLRLQMASAPNIRCWKLKMPYACQITSGSCPLAQGCWCALPRPRWGCAQGSAPQLQKRCN